MNVQQLSSKSWGAWSISLHVQLPEGQEVGVIYLTRNNRSVAAGCYSADISIAGMDGRIRLLTPSAAAHPPLPLALGDASNSNQTDFQIPAADREQICKSALD